MSGRYRPDGVVETVVDSEYPAWCDSRLGSLDNNMVRPRASNHGRSSGAVTLVDYEAPGLSSVNLSSSGRFSRQIPLHWG